MTTIYTLVTCTQIATLLFLSHSVYSNDFLRQPALMASKYFRTMLFNYIS